MAIATFIIPQNLVSKLTSSSFAVGEVLNKVLQAAENAKVICDALAAFHDDGSPVVNKFELDESALSYDAVTEKGQLMFRYQVNYTFGCSDLSPTEKSTERCDFDINNGLLKVHIHDPISRDTFDEL